MLKSIPFRFWAILIFCLISTPAFSAEDEAPKPLSIEEELAKVSSGELIIPENIAKENLGTATFPVVQCPRANERYKDLLIQLETIKTRIKDEACKKDQTDELIEKSVKDPGELARGRKDFIALIKKGSLGTEELSADEINQAKAYVENVVTTVAYYTGFINNPACFGEDSPKVHALSSLSSLVSGVTGVLGSIPGPLGAKIDLGGNLVESLLDSVNKIRAATEHYDFNNEDPKEGTRYANLYQNTLCAYFDLKESMEQYANPVRVLRELKKFRARSNTYFANLETDCDFCSEVTSLLLKQLGESESYDPFAASEAATQAKEVAAPAKARMKGLTAEESAGIDVETGGDPFLYDDTLGLPTTALEAAPSVEVEVDDFNAEGKSFKEIVDHYAPAVVDYLKEVKSQSAPGMPVTTSRRMGPHSDGDAGFESAPALSDGRLTNPDFIKLAFMFSVRTARLRHWVDTNIPVVEQLEREGYGDIAFDSVKDTQAEIEDVLLEEVGVDFVKHYTSVASKTFDKWIRDIKLGTKSMSLDLADFFLGELRRMRSERDNLNPLLVDSEAYHQLPRDARKAQSLFFIYGVTPELVAKAIEARGSSLGGHFTVEEVMEMIEEEKYSIENGLSRVRSKFEIVNRQCEFFEVLKLTYDSYLGEACREKMDDELSDMKRFFEILSHEDSPYLASFREFDDVDLEKWRLSRFLGNRSPEPAKPGSLISVQGYAKNWLDSYNKTLEYYIQGQIQRASLINTDGETPK